MTDWRKGDGPSRAVRKYLVAFEKANPNPVSPEDADRHSRRQRKNVEMLFAHLKRILKLARLRLRGPSGAHDEFLLAATAQNLRRVAKR
nr:transposase [Paraburkholderia lycopersici]